MPQLNGNKTRIGLILASLKVLTEEALKLTDDSAATTFDMATAATAAWVLMGAAHAIWKDWRGAAPKAEALTQ